MHKEFALVALLALGLLAGTLGSVATVWRMRMRERRRFRAAGYQGERPWYARL